MVGYRKNDLIWKDDGDASVVCGIIECNKLEFVDLLVVKWEKEE